MTDQDLENQNAPAGTGAADRQSKLLNQYTAIPTAMREAQRWLLWRLTPPKPGSSGKPQKKPYCADGAPRSGALDSPDDRTRLVTFDAALAALAADASYSGLGFALGPDGTGNYWQGVDLDNVPDRPGLQTLAACLPGYREKSPSGRGHHSIGYGKEFKTYGSNNTGAEAYARARFFTVTGMDGTGEPECIEWWVSQLLAPAHSASQAPLSGVVSTSPRSLFGQQPLPPGVMPHPTSPAARGGSPSPVPVFMTGAIDDLRSALMWLSAGDYGTWVACGHNLKCLGDAGRELWLEWSRNSTKWQEDYQAKWDNFDGTRSDYRAVFAKAQAAGWVNPASNGGSADGGELVPVDLAGIMTAHLEPPGFVIASMVPRGVMTLLGGHGGVGKSMLALSLCAHAACGRVWAGLSVAQCGVVFFSLEDDANVIRYRLRRIIEVCELPADAVLGNLKVFDGSAANAVLMMEGGPGAPALIETPTMAVLAGACVGAGLIMVDNASDAFAGNENARVQVRAFMRRLGQVARDNNAGVVLLAHIDKAAARGDGAGNNYSGSTAWHNSARSRLALVNESTGLTLRHEKANLGPRVEPIRLRYADFGVLVPSGETAASDAASDADAVLRVLRIASQVGTSVPTASTGPATAWHALSAMPELGEVYRTAEGKRRVVAALVKLEREGWIVRTKYKKPNRHESERWTVAHTSTGALA